MSNSQKNTRQYSIINLETRKQLIKRVIQQGYSINSSARHYGIKLSTAKAIVLRFRKTGNIEIQRKFKKTQEIQLSSNERSEAKQKQEAKSNIYDFTFNSYWYNAWFEQYAFYNFMNTFITLNTNFSYE